MWHVWLVWIPPTKRNSMKRVENFERYVIFSCYYSLILLIRWFVLLCLFVILDLIFKWFYSLDNYPFQFVPHWTLIVYSFVFECRNLLGSGYIKWYPEFCFCGVYLCFHKVLTTEFVIIPFDLHWVVMVKIISSCLCSLVVVQSAMRQGVVSHF